jgi:glutamate-1-semialdehyde 2,1-aminomutase
MSVEHVSQYHSAALFERAQEVIPGGVNSPVRAFRSVGGTPPFLNRGEGAEVWDEDGNAYIDFVASWGPLILGHAAPRVVSAIVETARLGTSFGAPTRREIEIAELLVKHVPCAKMARLVSSGTEAVMTAIRLCRAHTGRDYVLKFDGGYHGHSDGLLAKGGSGLATNGLPSSPGVPQAVAGLTISVPFNDFDALQEVVDARGNEIACLIAEPIPANMGVVLPQKGYWESVQKILSEKGILLIFDEVITGFRLGLSGAQGLLGVTPDVCTLGKIVGGGMPMGAIVGRGEILSQLAPLGSVYQAGTLSGNPVSVAAGLATLRELETNVDYGVLERRTKKLADGLLRSAEKNNVPMVVNQVGSMLTPFFVRGKVQDFSDSMSANTKLYSVFFHAALCRGVMLPPSQFESLFVSWAHTEEHIDKAVSVFEESIAQVAKVFHG